MNRVTMCHAMRNACSSPLSVALYSCTACSNIATVSVNRRNQARSKPTLQGEQALHIHTRETQAAQLSHQQNSGITTEKAPSRRTELLGHRTRQKKEEETCLVEEQVLVAQRRLHELLEHLFTNRK